MKAIKYLEELIEQEQNYLCGYDDDEKPQTHIERLKDLRLALSEVKNCSSDVVRLPLPDSEEISNAAIEYAEIEEDDPFDISVRDAAHFVAGATWYHKRIKRNEA